MLKLIGKMRRQPKQRRHNIAFGFASGFTFLVGAIWLFNVPSTFNGVLSATDADGNDEQSFFETMSSQAAAVRESISADSPETESLQGLMDEYRASSAQASSTQSMPSGASATSTGTASTTATSTPPAPKETFERFGTDTSYESEKPREVRIQAVSKATTSTTTSE